MAGNHEYYTQMPMNGEEEKFTGWLASNHPQVNLLRDEAVSIGGVNFFGGTLWTDFRWRSGAMEAARSQINDFRLIRNPEGTVFRPVDAVALHVTFVSKASEVVRAGLSRTACGDHP